MSWPDEEIEAMRDPVLNVKLVNEVKKDFEPTFSIFVKIVEKHKEIFKKKLDRPLFDLCYGMVMTRCFGWGLP